MPNKEPKSKRVTRHVVAKSIDGAHHFWMAGLEEKSAADARLEHFRRIASRVYDGHKVFKCVMTITEAK